MVGKIQLVKVHRDHGEIRKENKCVRSQRANRDHSEIRRENRCRDFKPMWDGYKFQATSSMVTLSLATVVAEAWVPLLVATLSLLVGRTLSWAFFWCVVEPPCYWWPYTFGCCSSWQCVCPAGQFERCQQQVGVAWSWASVGRSVTHFVHCPLACNHCCFYWKVLGTSCAVQGQQAILAEDGMAYSFR